MASVASIDVGVKVLLELIGVVNTLLFSIMDSMISVVELLHTMNKLQCVI